jgi:hypothetical protein
VTGRSGREPAGAACEEYSDPLGLFKNVEESAV